MKRILLILLVLPAFCFGQTKAEKDAKIILDTANNGIEYEKTLTLKATKEKIINSSIEWIASQFPKAEIQSFHKDYSTGFISGIGYFTVTTKGFMSTSSHIEFTIQINAKEDKCRLKCINFKEIYISQYNTKRTIDLNKTYFSYLNNVQFPREGKNFYSVFKTEIEAIINSFSSHLTKATKDDF